MQTALKLKWHNLDPSDLVAAQVRDEVARLEHFSKRITGCTVTLEAPSQHHRQAGAQYRVLIELAVPRGKLVVGRDPPKTRAHADLYAAIKAAFKAAQRQVEEHARRLDGRVKAHEAPAVATVARLLRDEGYGFLRTADDRDVYFHARSVVGGAFGDLEEGAEVRFVEEAGDEGPQASTVTPTRARRKNGASLREVLPRPDPRTSPLVALLLRRRSHREFAARALAPEEITTLLWAAQGVTSAEGGRAAPSAGGLHPLALTLVDARGVRRYVPAEHALAPVASGDRRARLAAAALDQECLAEAPAILAISATPAVLAPRYGKRSERYCALEAGHVAENVLLMAASLGLAAVPVAAFDDDPVRELLALADGEQPLYLLAVGAPRAPAS